MRFDRTKRQVIRKRNLDEAYVKVKGECLYLYRAVGGNGDTLELLFSRKR